MILLPGANGNAVDGKGFFSRRRFIAAAISATSLGAATSLSFPAYAAPPEANTRPRIPQWPQPNEIRQIWLRRAQTGEEAVLRYWDGATLLRNDYNVCCHLLRDVRAEKSVQMRFDLLDLLFAMQKWLVAHGVDKPLVITSGFRSVTTNRNTEGAAKNSAHLYAMAADITMPGISPDLLGRLAASFTKGGVGFYLRRGFIHVDCWRVRYWKG